MEPSKDQLKRWHDKYGPIFTVAVEDKEFICREISRGEYKSVLDRFEDGFEREEEICRICILYPAADLDSEYAGLASSLAEHILLESGFGESDKVEELMEKYREEMNDFMNQVSCIIHEAFPMKDLEEIEGWSLERTLWYYSRAEWKLKFFRGLGAQQDIGDGEVEANSDDFPELAAEKAFMSGKMR